MRSAIPCSRGRPCNGRLVPMSSGEDNLGFDSSRGRKEFSANLDRRPPRRSAQSARFVRAAHRVPLTPWTVCPTHRAARFSERSASGPDSARGACPWSRRRALRAGFYSQILTDFLRIRPNEPYTHQGAERHLKTDGSLTRVRQQFFSSFVDRLLSPSRMTVGFRTRPTRPYKLCPEKTLDMGSS